MEKNLSRKFHENLTSAKIIADSISPSGVRMTTFEVEFYRGILAEVNTHRMISKNGSSTRAIPLKTQIERMRNGGAFTPNFWGINQAGMAADSQFENEELEIAKKMWNEVIERCIVSAELLNDAKFHKQLSGRFLEPVMMQKMVLTATDWKNFFWLRDHCYSDDTEMLTQNGWKFIKDVNVGDVVYTLNTDTNKPEYSTVINTIQWDHDEDAVRLLGKSTDLIMSKKHTHLIADKNGKIKKVFASELIGNKTRVVKGNLPVDVQKDPFFIIPEYTQQRFNQNSSFDVLIPEKNVSSLDFFYVLGFFIGNGWTSLSEKSGNFSIFFCKGGSKSDFVLGKLKNCLNRITENSVHEKNKGNMKILGVSDVQLYQLFKDFGKSFEKDIPSYVWDYDYDSLNSLFEGLMDSDSNWLSTETGLKFSTSSKKLADSFQRLCMLIGKTSTISTINRIGKISEGVDSNGEPYKIATKRVNYSISLNDNITPSIQPAFYEKYTGKMVCVEVEKNNTIFVRRNGKVAWSGNCAAQPEFHYLTTKMREEFDKSVPVPLDYGQWHLPYVNAPILNGIQHFFDQENNEIDLETAKKISVSCCAQTSYRKLDGSLTKAEDIMSKLNLNNEVRSENRSHSSPTEHQGTPIQHWYQDGVTHLKRLKTVSSDSFCVPYSGNLRGWVQLRQTLFNHDYPEV